MDSYLVQYLGYCTGCNSTNPSHPFNPMTPYFNTSSGLAGNPCAHSRFHFSFPFLNFTKTLSPLSQYLRALSVTLPNAPLSQPQLRLHHSLNIHVCSLPLPQPCHHYFLRTQLWPISKNSGSPSKISTLNTHTLFRPRSERESKGWGLERIRSLSENLMLFRPKSEKGRVRVLERIGQERSWCLFRFNLWRDMRLREKEREFGQRREEANIRGGVCDEPALPIWACFRERPPLSKRVFFYLYFF